MTAWEDKTGPHDDVPLSTLVERGGIYYNVSGSGIETFVTELIRLIPGLNDMEPPGNPGFKTDLIRAVLEREALMSTGIGQGIALPHPRNPLTIDAERQYVSIGFPAAPLDWKALDGRPVHTALLIVSSSAKFHLHTLLKINFLCRNEDFLSLLKSRAPRDRIAGAIREVEQSWA
ncbi:MAG: PTS sugar transporter subunit IIA [Treponema sp.]|jgi:PTS system nitrogen regulatory IIA component|nr:PTS sugar transporter subunit IIA [Treponema sp.]